MPSAVLENVQATVREGDKVEVLVAGQWLQGFVEEIPDETSRASDGSSLAGGLKVLVRDRCKYMVGPSDVPKAVRKAANCLIVGPGAGIGGNSATFLTLARSPKYHVEVIGRSGRRYDCYPSGWEQGRQPPNLTSFGQEVASMKAVAFADCLIFGSRGGQVVLPELWRLLGNKVPPCLVFNGGCAMTNLPGRPVIWPDTAISFLLIGGQDYFRCKKPREVYLNDTRKCVPERNCTTVILYVREMNHMPQEALLQAILIPAIECMLVWQETGRAPEDRLIALVQTLAHNQWSGRIQYTAGLEGGRAKWKGTDFGALGPDEPKHIDPFAQGPKGETSKTPIDVSRETWRSLGLRPDEPPTPANSNVTIVSLEVALNQNTQGMRDVARKAKQEADAEVLRREEELRQAQRRLALAQQKRQWLLRLSEANEATASEDAAGEAAKAARKPQAAPPSPVLQPAAFTVPPSQHFQPLQLVPQVVLQPRVVPQPLSARPQMVRAATVAAGAYGPPRGA